MTFTRKLSPNANAHPADVVGAKLILRGLGHYDAPDWGVSEYPDRDLFDAIKDFQSKHGLKADGVINADGETVQALAQRLQSLGRNGDTILAHITPDEAELLDRVTDGGSVNPITGLAEFSDWGDFFGGFFGGSDDDNDTESETENSSPGNMDGPDGTGSTGNSSGSESSSETDSDSGSSSDDDDDSGSLESGGPSPSQQADAAQKGNGEENETLGANGFENNGSIPNSSNPSSKSNASKGSFNVIGDMLESFGNILNGEFTNLSAHDTKVANAMALQYGGKPQDYTRNSSTNKGPGKGRYSYQNYADALAANPNVSGSSFLGSSKQNQPDGSDETNRRQRAMVANLPEVAPGLTQTKEEEEPSAFTPTLGDYMSANGYVGLDGKTVANSKAATAEAAGVYNPSYVASVLDSTVPDEEAPGPFSDYKNYADSLIAESKGWLAEFDEEEETGKGNRSPSKASSPQNTGPAPAAPTKGRGQMGRRAVQRNQQLHDYVEGLWRSAADSVTLDSQSEVSGAAAAAYGFTRAVEEGMTFEQAWDVAKAMYSVVEEETRTKQEAFAKDNPVTAAGISLGGSLLTGAAAGAGLQKAMKGASAVSQWGAGLSLGSALSGASGWLSAAPGERVGGALMGASTGLMAGKLTSAGSILRRSVTNPSVSTLNLLESTLPQNVVEALLSTGLTNLLEEKEDEVKQEDRSVY